MKNFPYKLLAIVLGVMLVLAAIPLAIVLFFVPVTAHWEPTGPVPTPEVRQSGGGLVALKSYTSSLYGYTLRYPATWGIKVNTSAPAGNGTDPEYLTLYPGENMLPVVNIYALTGTAPFTGYENCAKNTVFQGIQACRISQPAGQQPASELLVFEKGDAHFEIALQYEDPASLDVFEQVLSLFEFAK